MNVWREWLCRLRHMVRPRHGGIDEDLRTYREFLVEQLQASGMTEADARRTAGTRIGSTAAVVEAYQDQSGLPIVENWLRDVRYAIRSLRRTPAATLAMVTVLGLGIGFSSAVTTVLHAIAWQPLPVPEAARVVKLGAQFSGQFSRRVQGGEWFVSLPELETYRQQTRTLTMVAGLDEEQLTWQHDGTARSLRAALVTGDYFPLLEVRPAIGRLFGARDHDALVAVVSHRFWSEDLAADPAVIGRSLVFAGTPYTVVAVMDSAFSGTESIPVDVWAPLEAAVRARGDAASLQERDFSWLQAIGRLAPDVSVASATVELNAIAARLDHDHPGRRTAMTVTRAARLDLVALGSHDRGNLIAGATTAALLVLVLLLICGSNVAALQLARGASREKEFAIHIALGAGRRRLVQSLSAELLAIAGTSAMVGVAISAGTLQLLQHWLPLREIVGPLRPDVRMLLGALAYAAMTTGIFGFPPVRQALRLDCLAGLKGRQRSMPAMRLRRLLTAAQVAISLLLLLAAAWMARGSAQALRIDLGYSTEGLFIVQPDRASVPGGSPADLTMFVDRLDEALTATPGISNVGKTLIAPFWGTGTTQVKIEGRSGLIPVRFSAADARYFQTLGVTPSAGRIPRPDESDAILVNAAFARKFWGTDGQALGHTVNLPRYATAMRQPMSVVGVIPTLHTVDVGQADAPMYYLPSVTRDATMQSLLVRAVQSTPTARVVMQVARALSPGTFVRVVPVTDRVQAQVAPARLGASVAAFVGLLSLVVAAVGIYGIVSHAVTAGTREIGIRMALGAPRRRILLSVIGANLRSAAIGAGVTATCLIVFSQFASAQFRVIFLGLDPADPVPFAAAALALALVIGAAAYLPARRVLAVDPITALNRD